jgi:hypothetical protein
MTLGVGIPGRNFRQPQHSVHDRGLAQALSGDYGSSTSFELHRGMDPSDGANQSGGSNYSEGMPLSPSSAGLSGVLGASDPEVLKQIAQLDRYMSKEAGVPWPTPYRSYDATKPTVSARKSNINKGWNAAAQPGAAPGLQDLRMGALTYAEAMNWTPAPLTDNLGALATGPYMEPGSELRPGFGGVDGWNVLDLLIIAGGAYGGYKLAQDRETSVKAAATLGGSAAGLVVAVLTHVVTNRW